MNTLTTDRTLKITRWTRVKLTGLDRIPVMARFVTVQFADGSTHSDLLDDTAWDELIELELRQSIDEADGRPVRRATVADSSKSTESLQTVADWMTALPSSTPPAPHIDDIDDHAVSPDEHHEWEKREEQRTADWMAARGINSTRSTAATCGVCGGATGPDADTEAEPCTCVRARQSDFWQQARIQEERTADPDHDDGRCGINRCGTCARHLDEWRATEQQAPPGTAGAAGCDPC